MLVRMCGFGVTRLRALLQLAHRDRAAVHENQDHRGLGRGLHERATTCGNPGTKYGPVSTRYVQHAVILVRKKAKERDHLPDAAAVAEVARLIAGEERDGACTQKEKERGNTCVTRAYDFKTKERRSCNFIEEVNRTATTAWERTTINTRQDY